MLRLAALLVLLALPACTAAFDGEQQRLCRQAIVPANAPGNRIVVEAPEPGPRPQTLRIPYRIEIWGRTPLRRTIDCLFAAGGLGQGRGALIGIAHDGEPMSEASFRLLRRFYLEDRADPPPDPGQDGAIALPELPPALAYGLQQVLAGLPSLAVYGLMASAYALIYGLTGRIILCFGEFAALGALASVVGVAVLGGLAISTPAGALAAAFVVAVLVASLHGFALGRAVLGPLRRSASQHGLIATIGLAIALSEYLRLAQGPELRWLPPVMNEPWALARAGGFVVTLTPIRLLLAGLGLGVTLGIVAAIRHGRYGRAWRAVSDDARTAALFGVNARAVHDRALILGCAACGLAGVIVTVLYGGMGFAGGFTLGLKALVAAVLGGIGSVGGAALGGFAIGLFEIAWSATMPLEQRDIAVFALLAIVLALRPGGFFGQAALAPRQV